VSKPADVHKATAASQSHGNSKKFSGERKGPPEAIVPAPEAIVQCGECKGPPEAIVPAPEAIVPCDPLPMPLWEWTPPSGVEVLPVKPSFEPIIHTMPTLVAHDFAAAVPRASRGYPGSNNGEYYKIGGEEGKNGEDYDMAGEVGKNGGEDYDDEDYESAGSG
jgi:hypothetical protein